MNQRSTLGFLKTEAASGVVIGVAVLAALIVANSPWASQYYAFIQTPLTVQLGDFRETLSLADWVKDGLMTIFFFVIAMELKFEILKGELANPRRLALPLLAAAGGLASPALIFIGVNGLDGPVPAGWAIPAGTDTAFALAALAAVSRGLPGSLRLFLLTIAIADTVAAVVIVGLIFAQDVRLAELAGAAAILLAMALLGRWRRAPYLFYALGFIILWGFVLKSGINTSLAGLAAAMTIPAASRRHGEQGVLRHFLHGLHGYVAFGILPAFAFVAAGFSFAQLDWPDLLAPLPLGLAAGLFLGKQAGVFGAAALAVAMGIGRKPTGATWLEIYGVSILCGIGVTVSLFLGASALVGADQTLQAQVRLGVALGSAASLGLGAFVIGYASQLRAWRGAALP